MFENKRFVITGAAGYVGQALMLKLAHSGAEVIATDMHTRIDNQEICSSYYQCDLADLTQVDILGKKIASQEGIVDGFVHSASLVGTSNTVGWTGDFLSQKVQTMELAYRVNSLSGISLIQNLMQNFSLAEQPSIVLVSSIYGSLGIQWDLYEGTSMSSALGYGMSKAALEQAAKYLATALGPKIRVNCVAPGGLWRDQPQLFVDRYTTRTVLKRMGTEEDVVQGIEYLLSENSRYITGQTIMIDGGWSVC